MAKKIASKFIYSICWWKRI